MDSDVGSLSVGLSGAARLDSRLTLLLSSGQIRADDAASSLSSWVLERLKRKRQKMSEDANAAEEECGRYDDARWMELP